MEAADPTYPFLPIACLLSSVMLLLVLMTSFIRQRWNLGVTFLCFWLFIENITSAVSAVIWSDNADVKLYVYCDIVTHLQIIAAIVKPMATLIITRRLHLIASLESVELPSRAARRRDLAIEWTLGLLCPLLVAGPIYYVDQGARFTIYEGSGCATAEEESILEVLIQELWSIVPPLISVIVYYPRVVRTYYRQSKDINSFLRSNPSISRTNYLRILILASIDILFILPIGVVNVALYISATLSPPKYLPFYPGWAFLHADWTPNYFINWTSPVLAFVIFGLFGATAEARASYWRIICTVGGWLGWKPTLRARNGRASLGEINFGARPRETGTSGLDLEMGSRPPSFVNTQVTAMRLDVNEGSGDGSATDLKSIGEARLQELLDGKDTEIDGRPVGNGGSEPFRNLERTSGSSVYSTVPPRTPGGTRGGCSLRWATKGVRGDRFRPPSRQPAHVSIWLTGFA
ncbi:unnamed protein product [Peniophora sp. CBMAI 1063]|nr:unnamed protein product [Peniophora sp. CBMAI 1063]